MTQRDGIGREVGRGFRIGNTCTPMADACWCMAKPIQYCKVKKKKKHRKKNTEEKNKLHSLAKNGLINVGFVMSKNTMLSFLSSLLPPPSSFPFLSYYTTVNVCFPFIVNTEYWHSSPRCTIHPWAHLTPNTVCLPLPHLCIALPSSPPRW